MRGMAGGPVAPQSGPLTGETPNLASIRRATLKAAQRPAQWLWATRRDCASWRQAAMALVYHETGLSLKRIAAAFDRDRSTVLYAYRKFCAGGLNAEVGAIREHLK